MESIAQEGNYSWIKVKRYVDDPSLTWEERYRKLEEHHQKETEFLIKTCRELACQILQLSISEQKNAT